ncbi:MAG: hypothetical protein RI973_1587 [Bacteroidota bacterium]|jgi:arginine-tRNA-protein transferase
MFTEKQFCEQMRGETLDGYLERGWYRMGQAVFTCHFLFFDDNLYSPVWVRLPLRNYRFRKSLRRLQEKVLREFTVSFRPAVIDEEKEALFQVYRDNFNGRLSPTLKVSLQDNEDINVFDTWELTVHKDGKLVAYSFFDLGKQCLASIKGVFDPEFSSYSLGLFTMLQEIQFGLDHGYEYFYPGYVVPGYSRFDYKLRIGSPEEVEFYELKSGDWLAYTNFSEGLLPIKMLTQKLFAAAKALQSQKIASQMLFYPAYEAGIFGYTDERFLESPLFLHLFSNVFPRPRFIIYYDIWKEAYVFTHCMPLEDLGFYFEYSMQFDTQEARHFLDFILEKTKIVESPDPEVLVSYALQIASYVKPSDFRGFMK